MNKTNIITLLFLVCISQMAFAQDSLKVKPTAWTLEDCINWAKQENVSVKRGRVSVEQQRINIADARSSRLPSVSFSTNQGLSYQPFRANSLSVNGSQVTTNVHKAGYSGSYGLSASMPLYDGGQISNNIKLQELNSQIAELSVDQTLLTIEENITKLYVQILYAQESLKQDDEQIALAQQQLDRAKALFKAGLLNKADVSQMESQLANDQYQKVADETSLADYKLQLKQLMELDGDYELQLADPVLEADVLEPLPSKTDVYQSALTYRPEIRAQQLAIDRTDLDVKIAEAQGKPSINANAGINTSNNTGGGNLFTQLKDQWNNSLGVSLSLPVWDHGKTKNAVAKAKLERETAELDLVEAQKSLWKTIENYWLQAYSSQQRYIAAQAKVDAARTSYELTSEQFRLGLKNILELTTDKTNYSASTQQMLQAKYMALLNIAMLHYYGHL
ncbi:MAG: TolC family protein [Muribaculaceae bacterium]|nr:TolC family protein [Muribaculaceae bacterium]